MPERKYDIPAGDEIDYAADVEKWLEKGATPTQVLFGEWIAEKADLGSVFKTAKEVEAAKLGVQLALKYRMHFQRSPENHGAKGEARAAREQEQAARPARKTRATAATEEDEAPAPKRRGRPAKATTEAAPAKPVRRGRAAAAATPATETKAPAKPGRRPAAAAGRGRAPRKGATKVEADF